MSRILCLLLTGFCVLAAPAAAQTDTTTTPAPAPDPVVLAGVTAGGTDLAGLTQAQAQARLSEVLAPHLQRTLVVRIVGRRYELPARDLKAVFDAETTAKRAIRATQPGDVGLKLTYSTAALKAFAAGLAAKIDRPGRDAELKITLKKVTVKRSVPGVAVPQKAVVEKLAERILTPGSSRLLRMPVTSVRAAVNADDVRKRLGGTVITIDKSHFKLRLFKHLKLAKTYTVAVGQPAYPTPSGRFRIQDKQVNPVWSVPNSPWAGELQGTTVPGGSPNNPLKARWMGITNGVGIHGTGQPWTVGTRASHGCIRMRVPDVIKLYPRVPVGTPVLIR